MSAFNLKTVIVVLVFVGLSLWAGFLIGRFTQLNGGLPGTESSDEIKIPPTIVNPLFSNQSAVIRGKILSTQNNSISVVNNNGALGTVKLMANYSVKVQESRAGAAAADGKTILLNRDVVINLLLANGEYQAVSLLYPPSLP